MDLSSLEQRKLRGNLLYFKGLKPSSLEIFKMQLDRGLDNLI